MFTAHASTTPGVNYYPDFKYDSKEVQTGCRALSRLFKGYTGNESRTGAWPPGSSKELRRPRLLPAQGNLHDCLPQRAGRAWDTWETSEGPLRGEGSERRLSFYLTPNSTSLSLGTPPLSKRPGREVVSPFTKKKKSPGPEVAWVCTPAHEHTHRNTLLIHFQHCFTKKRTPT